MVKSGITWRQNIGSPFYLHNVCKACCAWSVSTLTVNADHAHLERTGNTLRWQMQTDFPVLQSETQLYRQRSRQFANYSLRNPECVSSGLRAVQPTQMFTGMKRCDYMVAALWPLECAFKGDSRAEYISLWHHITDYSGAIRPICTFYPSTTPGTQQKKAVPVIIFCKMQEISLTRDDPDRKWKQHEPRMPGYST